MRIGKARGCFILLTREGSLQLRQVRSAWIRCFTEWLDRSGRFSADFSDIVAEESNCSKRQHRCCIRFLLFKI